MRLFEGLRIEVLYLAVQGFGFKGYYTGLKYYKFWVGVSEIHGLWWFKGLRSSVFYKRCISAV